MEGRCVRESLHVLAELGDLGTRAVFPGRRDVLRGSHTFWRGSRRLGEGSLPAGKGGVSVLDEREGCLRGRAITGRTHAGSSNGPLDYCVSGTVWPEVGCLDVTTVDP